MDVARLQAAEHGYVETNTVTTMMRTVPNYTNWGADYGPYTAESYGVSSLHGLCFRAKVLEYRLGTRYNNETMDECGLMIPGSALHDYWQNNILPRLFTFIGTWVCLNCGNRHRLCPRPEHCSSCGERARLYYEEIELRHKSLAIKGHLDGVIKVGDNYQLIELKSVDPELFKKAKDAESRNFGFVPPLSSHLFQARAYLWLCGFKTAKLLYINKSDNKVLEFTVNANPETATWVDNLILFVRHALATKMPLCEIHGVCKKESDTRAKRCPYASECFSGDDFVLPNIAKPISLSNEQRYLVVDKNVTLLKYLKKLEAKWQESR